MSCDLSVVVPVYENRATLDELIDRLMAVLEPLPLSFELVFVDDGSRDKSFERLAQRAAADPRIRAHALTRNFGSQAAICAGFDLARGKRVACLDADLENLPEDLPALLAALDRGHDLACGVREGRRDPWLARRIPSWLLNRYVRRVTGTSVRDVGCGMRAMESWIVKDLAAEGEHRRLITPLLLQRARSVGEVPIRHRPKDRSGGHSFFTLFAVATDYYLLTARRPFLRIGVGAGGVGVVGLALLGVGLVAGSPGAALGGLVLVVGSVLAGLLCLIGEYAQRLYQIGQGISFYQLRDGSEGESAATSARANSPRVLR